MTTYGTGESGSLIPFELGGAYGGGGTTPGATGAGGSAAATPFSWRPPSAGNFTSVPFNQTYGGQPAPYADLSAQILDSFRMPTRYNQAWTWNNGANRYNFGRGGLFGSAPQGSGGGSQLQNPRNMISAPGQMPSTAPTFTLNNTPSPPGANPPPSQFGPPPPTTRPPTPGSSGSPPNGAQQDLASRWNSLGSDEARAAFIGGPFGLQNARALLSSGLLSHGDINRYDALIGGRGGYDPATGRPWISNDGMTRTYL